MTKRDQNKLINAMVRSNPYLGGERSKTAGPLFYDIADVCRKLSYSQLERVMRQAAYHYLYD